MKNQPQPTFKAIKPILLFLAFWTLGSLGLFAQTDPNGTVNDDSGPSTLITDLNANLRLWLDATDKSTLYTTPTVVAGQSISELETNHPGTDYSGTEIRLWLDKSSYHSNVDNTVNSAFPEYVSDGGTTNNNLPTLEFSKSTSDHLMIDLPVTDSGNGEQWTSDYSVFIVFEQLQDGGVDDAFFSNGNTFADDNHFQISVSAATGNDFVFKSNNGTPDVKYLDFETEKQNELKLYSLRASSLSGVEALVDGVRTDSDPSFTNVGRSFTSYKINKNRNNNRFNDSRITEVIIYDRRLSDCELDEVNKYLGNKYGKDFSSSFGALFDTDTDTNFNNAVVGIGLKEDICGGTEDKRNTATSNGMTLTVDDADNTVNRNYIAFSDNNGSETTNDNAPTDTNLKRLDKVWMLQEFGNEALGDQAMDFEFDIPSIWSHLAEESFAILVDGDGDFSNAEPMAGGTVNAGKVTFSDITLGTDTSLNLDITTPVYIALAIQTGPGGIAANLQGWWKADGQVYSDAGTTSATNADPIYQWSDFSMNGNDFIQSDSGKRPIFSEATLNFNPQATFDGSNGTFMEGSGTSGLPSGNSARFMRVVATTTAAFTGNHVPFAHGGATQNEAHLIAGSVNSNGLIYSSWEPVNDITSTNFWTQDHPNIIGGAFDGTSSTYLQANGTTLVTDNDGTPPTWSTVNFFLRIGADVEFSPGEFWTGHIAEVMVYDTYPSAAEQQQVDSYLALKYGITLDQSTAMDYVATDGTVVWDGTVNASYKTDIFGIGQDDASGLNQKISQSVHNENGPILATTQDFTNSNVNGSRTALGEGNFMIMGHNNASQNSFTSSFDGGTNNRLNRVWKVEETGMVNAVFIAIPKSAITFPAGIPNIVVSGDETFDTTDTLVELNDDGTYYWASINPSDGDYVTFASPTPDFTISQTSLTFDENAGSSTFTVVLDVKPASDVVLDITSDDTDEATVDKSQLTFTSADWDTPQTVTVTGVNDDIDRNDSATITIAVNDAASDDSFDALADKTVAITLTDDDTANFTVSETTLTLDENAGADTFTVVLDSEPTSDVILDISSDDTDEATVDKAQLTFTSADWDTPQTVTVTGVDDDIDRNDSATITISVNDAASDDTFDALADKTVAITLTDNDTANFTVSETALTVDENAGTDTFTVVLDSEPTSDVVLDISSGDTDEATVDKAQLTFTSADWDTPQTVTVTGVDDDIDRNDSATITIAVNDAASDDSFDALADKTVAITLTDDDTANFTVSETALTVDENAGTDTFTVVLDSGPTSDVVLDISSGDTDEATVDKAQLTFTSADWDTPQTVTVTGVDDLAVSDDTATISIVVNDGSSDDTFDGLSDKTIAITLTNNDFDSDGDGVLDAVDNCVSISNANQLDTDSDGEGDVCDTDDDGDGTPDVDDAFPLDPTEDTDTDGDGVGNNADTDDDNDLLLDGEDPNPLVDTQTTAPSLILPVPGETSYDNITIHYYVPEDPLANSVQVIFSSTEDPNSPITLQLENPLRDELNTIIIDAKDLASATEVISASSSSLVNGALYDVTLRYQDALGNPTAQDTNNDHTIITDLEFTHITISSNNASSELARAGDRVSVEFGFNRPVDEVALSILGSTLMFDDSALIGENTYLGWIEVNDTMSEGIVGFTLTANPSTDNLVATNTTDGSTVTIDTTAPQPSLVIDESLYLGPFTIQLQFSEPVFDLAPFPVEIVPGPGGETMATMGALQEVTPGLAYNIPVTPLVPGELVFFNVNNGIARDEAGNYTLPLGIVNGTYYDLDTDNDGIGDSTDTDDDNDGTPDTEDAFPLDDSEDTDADGDGTGDNADTDDDNDGTLDADDAFPLDDSEDTDTDGDGQGDNSDDDIDGDGIPNEEDIYPNGEITDTDNDGVADDEDAFPNDPNESVDSDGDGTGDNADTDDDNDGTPDGEDAFPLDDSEDTDTDGDGMGDNEDEDDDNDGVPDNDATTDNEPTIVPAQAFTPNGDGNNDTWVVPGIENYPNNVVKVYNRSGHEVFAARSYQNTWGGYYKGKHGILPAGSYLYVIDFGDGSAPKQGWIFINY